LNQLPRLLGPDFAPAVVDCQNPAVTGSAPTLLRYLCQTVGDGLQRRRVTVVVPGRSDFQPEPFDTFNDWLCRVDRALPPGLRVLLCLDEYERLQKGLDAGWGADLLDMLRHILQHHSRWVLMLVGACTFEELGPAWTDRFISARRVRVSFLSRAEVEPLLTAPVLNFDMRYQPGALDALVDATRGQPFLTQAVAFELVVRLNSQQRKETTVEDVYHAVAEAIQSGAEYFANVWSDAGTDGQAILSALVRGEPLPKAGVARDWLRRHDVLDDAGRFAVPMVAQWVRQKVARETDDGDPIPSAG
jgi:hypothetical protein